MPILFTLRQNPAQGVWSARQIGSPRLLVGSLPLPASRLLISGVTRDGAGVAIGSCIVTLYRTDNDLVQSELTSDATTGAYEFSAGLGTSYYIVAYKAGAPDLSGTTVNTLIGTG